MGKAKVLRKRVSSYLRKGGPAPTGRIPEMVARARDVEWVVTASESEALILEDNFIKEHRPPYNLRLRDDKSYPYIEITMTDEWPRVRFMRGRHVPGNLYFGPYSSARKVRDTLELIGSHLPVPQVQGGEAGKGSGSPCLQYFIKRSLAPCDGRVPHDEYMAVIAQVEDFLRGRLGAVERDIERAMAEAAEAQRVRDGGAPARPARGRAPRARAPDRAHRQRRGVRRHRSLPGRSGGERAGLPRPRRRRRRPADLLRRQRGGARDAGRARGVPARVLLGRERGAAAGDRAAGGRWRRARRGARRAPRHRRGGAPRPARPQASSDGARAAQRRAGGSGRGRASAAATPVAGGGARAAARRPRPRRAALAHRVLRHLQPGRAPAGGLDGRLRGRSGEEGPLPQVRLA